MGGFTAASNVTSRNSLYKQLFSAAKTIKKRTAASLIPKPFWMIRTCNCSMISALNVRRTIVCSSSQGIRAPEIYASVIDRNAKKCPIISQQQDLSDQRYQSMFRSYTLAQISKMLISNERIQSFIENDVYTDELMTSCDEHSENEWTISQSMIIDPK